MTPKHCPIFLAVAKISPCRPNFLHLLVFPIHGIFLSAMFRHATIWNINLSTAKKLSNY